MKKSLISRVFEYTILKRRNKQANKQTYEDNPQAMNGLFSTKNMSCKLTQQGGTNIIKLVLI